MNEIKCPLCDVTHEHSHFTYDFMPLIYRLQSEIASLRGWKEGALEGTETLKNEVKYWKELYMQSLEKRTGSTIKN